jgi:general stress protein CsbA
VQTKLNLNNKNASFIVVISVFSFGIGAIVMSITNYFDKKSDKK